ncbi:AbfB domain-containing protein [Nonomuraea polychroma]|uniref:AbfB domain-containing protein n=1 Tax=Nonomuraea polychroma TaxID=46176 RepID=UPI003D929CC5
MSPRRMLVVGVALLTPVLSSIATLATERSASAATYSGYVMGYFKESPNQSGDSYALHSAVSSDGLNWMPLNQNNPVATPTAGMQGLRDPYILRKQDGTFVVLATDLKGRVFNLNNQYIHVWDSANLTSFTNYRRVRLHDMNTHSWAPNSFTTLTSGLRQGNAIEAPILVKSNTSNTFWLWGDSFSPANAVFCACQSSNVNGNAWSALNQRAYTRPINAKHATTTPITAAEQTALMNRWGTPQWNRLKSNNFPGRYLRHSSYALRLDPNDNTSTFRADATFYRTGGLADGAWASFRSYNHPDRYIRHSGYLLRIDPLSAGSDLTARQDGHLRSRTRGELFQ